MAVTYATGEIVLFKRDTEHGRRWELAEYLRPDPNARGWHFVRDDTGFRQRHYVPSRRIKKAPTRP